MTVRLSQAEKKLAACPAGDASAALDVARAFLDERGDVPAHVVQTLAMRVEDPLELEAAIDRLRAQWFAARGAPVPPPPTDPSLE